MPDYYKSTLTPQEVDAALKKIARLNDNILIDVSDDANPAQTAETGWAASPAGLAKVGTQIVTGNAVATGPLANGATATAAKIDIPTAGTWLVTMLGWWPDEITSGFISIPDVGSADAANFQFCLAGFTSVSGPTTLTVTLTNWSGNTVESVTMSATTLKAVRISA